MTRVSAMLAMCALTLAQTMLAQAPVQMRHEFPNTKTLGRALSECRDNLTHAVAAYYYSQDNHESIWLLIELGMASNKSFTIKRDQIELVTFGPYRLSLERNPLA